MTTSKNTILFVSNYSPDRKRGTSTTKTLYGSLINYGALMLDDSIYKSEENASIQNYGVITSQASTDIQVPTLCNYAELLVGGKSMLGKWDCDRLLF